MPFTNEHLLVYSYLLVGMSYHSTQVVYGRDVHCTWPEVALGINNCESSTWLHYQKEKNSDFILQFICNPSPRRNRHLSNNSKTTILDNQMRKKMKWERGSLGSIIRREARQPKHLAGIWPTLIAATRHSVQVEASCFPARTLASHPNPLRNKTSTVYEYEYFVSNVGSRSRSPRWVLVWRFVETCEPSYSKLEHSSSTPQTARLEQEDESSSKRKR